MSIYTRAGDAGVTGLADGTHVAKSSRRVRAYGTVDEANCSIGLARCALGDASLDAVLRFAQHRLMNCAAALASPVSASGSFLTRDDVDVLEAGIDRIEQRAERARGFVLPSGCEASVRLHLARTVVRRAEREVVALAEEPGVAVDANVLAFLNRLSDLLFAAAGAESEAADVAEEVWNRHAVPPGL